MFENIEAALVELLHFGRESGMPVTFMLRTLVEREAITWECWHLELQKGGLPKFRPIMDLWKSSLRGSSKCRQSSHLEL